MDYNDGQQDTGPVGSQKNVNYAGVVNVMKGEKENLFSEPMRRWIDFQL